VGESLVGRESTADVWLDSSSVSRRHARVVVGEDDVWLENLGSKNGTWVNGERVTERTRLNDPDHVRFGSVKMELRRA
jgi:pSer/pThr/pTyr-binding forkhead associated (FHA) protein